jgi:hypothetical protein
VKVSNLTFSPYRLRRKHRWQTASYTADAVRVLFVKLQADDGLIGVGAASVMPRDDASFEPGLTALEAVTAELLTGREIGDRDLLLAELDRRLPLYPRHLVCWISRQRGRRLVWLSFSAAATVKSFLCSKCLAWARRISWPTAPLGWSRKAIVI